MVAYTFEKLLFNYWKLNAESYDKLPEYSEKTIYSGIHIKGLE